MNFHNLNPPHVNNTQNEEENTTNTQKSPVCPVLGAPKTSPQFDDYVGDSQDSA